MRTNPMSLHALLLQPVVFELHHLGEEQKRFTCTYFLHAIFLLRKAGSAQREELQHAMIFDEAHNVFPREPPGELSMPARLAREIREYGEAIVSASQQADLSESMLANAGIKIILRCDYPKDMLFASQVLQISMEWIPKLNLGTGIARLPLRYLSPFQFTFTTTAAKNRPVSNEAVRTRYAERSASDTPQPLVIDQREEVLLRDVNEHPVSTITERYHRLNWHPQVGNRIKDSVVRKHLVTFQNINTGKARAKLLVLTNAGLTHLVTEGAAIIQKRHGGPVHEWWKRKVRETLQRRDHAVTEEAPLGSGRTADLRATTANGELYVEVETGASDLSATLAKYPRKAQLVVFLTSERLLAACAPRIAAQRPETAVATPATLVEAVRSLEGSFTRERKADHRNR